MFYDIWRGRGWKWCNSGSTCEHAWRKGVGVSHRAGNPLPLYSKMQHSTIQLRVDRYCTVQV